MPGCLTDKRSFETQVQGPVEQAFEVAEQFCEDSRREVEEKIELWIEQAEEQAQRFCQTWPWPLSLLCTWVTVIVKALVMVTVIVTKWVWYTVCKVVITVTRLAVVMTLRTAKYLWVLVCAGGSGDLDLLFKGSLGLYTSLVDGVEDFARDILRTGTDIAKGTTEDLVDVVGDVVAVAASSIFCGPAMQECRNVIKEGFRALTKTVNGFFDSAFSVADGGVLITSGLLRLFDTGKISEGLTKLSIGGFVGMFQAFRSPATIGDGFREGKQSTLLRDCLEDLIKELVPAENREGMRMAVGLDIGKVRMTWPVRLTRFYLDSEATDPSVNPRDLHPSFINLYDLCGGFYNTYSVPFMRPRNEMVITGTRQRPTWDDVSRYLANDPDRPRFRIYPMSRETLQLHIDTAVDKAREIGLHLVFSVVDQPAAQWFDARVSTVASPGPPPVFGLDLLLRTSLGRIGAPGEQCTLSANALVRDDPVLDPGIFGSTNFYPAEATVSGLEYRDAWPDYIFRYVLIHEIGHYFGLQHAGHTGPNHIMWSRSAAARGEVPYVSWETVGEALLSAQPRFMGVDACMAWRWILTNSQACIGPLPTPRPKPLPQ